MSIEVGSIVEGVVTGITNFGAFIELPGGQTGLVHISEVADSYVRDVKDYLKDKDRVKVKVIGVDKGKIGLSIKQAKPNVSQSTFERKSPPERRGFNQPARKPENFEDRLSKFMKESDERQQDIRRSTDSKRGGRGSKKSYKTSV
ncbi:S1 domain-containing RNA-binding protein [Phosphitispora sp. TUW77]|uniref:S1 domain-containing RNA-binding protein n=1 Tax=Phosphitispora sp. TUW77 TaxID=3152361 RepID=UPI003AB66929